MKIHRTHTKKLTALVLMTLLAGANTSFAYDKHDIYYNDKHMAELYILSAAEADGSEFKETGDTFFDLATDLQKGMYSATSYWTDMFGAGAKNPQPWSIAVVAINNYANASASPFTYDPEGNELHSNYIKESIQKGIKLSNVDDFTASPLTWDDGYIAFSSIRIGKYFGADRTGATDGYWVDADTPLPTNEQAADFVATFRHELGHALGIVRNSDDITDAEENTILGKDTIVRLNADDADTWNGHLVDQNNNALNKDKLVITSEEFATIKATKPEVTEADYFIVDTTIDSSDDSSTVGRLFFKGANVSEVLNGTTFYGVDGLPVNGWENDGSKYIFEGSHLQTTGMMSHRFYSNYTSFMEAELAVMQDLGYKLDRKAYFGKSIYNSGLTLTNTQGYSARNADGTAYLDGVYSAVPLGVGLHIYGSKNNITQAGDILTAGTGAVGVRMDGVENTLNIAKGTEIHADGERGMGLLVSYGRNHVVNQSGTVTALGTGGKAAVFDFGSSSNGARDEYRGSYIRFARAVDESTGNITNSKNYDLTDMDSSTYNSTADELTSSMVDAFNVNGTLAGAEDAIYIGKNAFVDEININKGAVLSGNITSEWKHFQDEDNSYEAAGSGEALKIQYNNNSYDYDAYIPALVTSLNINTDLSYDGDITGKDNMVLNVNSGTLNYGGTADVISVSVDEDAKVVGGTYTVNDMTAVTPSEYQDAAESTGKFYNHGTISAADESTGLTINGTLISDGTLTGYVGDGTGIVNVNGTADVTGSTVTMGNALPGENATVFKATSLTGDIANTSIDTAAKSGLLSYYGEIDGDEITGYAVAQDNLGAKSAEVAQGYEAVQNIYNALEANGDTRIDELRPVYNMGIEQTHGALSCIATDELRNDMANLSLRSDLSGRLITDRLHSVWSSHSSSDLVSIPGGKSSDTWIKFGKNWGDLSGGTNYHGSTITIGHDWRKGDWSREGIFASYRTAGVSATNANGRVQDTRFGYYGGTNKGAIETDYYADFGWQHNTTERGLFDNRVANGTENSYIFELGGSLNYDLHAQDAKLWRVVPYLAAHGSYLHQNGYNEGGAGVFNKHVASDNNSYFGMQAGVTLERPLPNGSYIIDLGVRQALTGSDLTRSFFYEGDPAHSYTFTNRMDRTHAIASITADAELTRGWRITGQAMIKKGAHEKDLSAYVELRHTW